MKNSITNLSNEQKQQVVDLFVKKTYPIQRLVILQI